MELLEELRRVLENQGLMDNQRDIKDRFEAAFFNDIIRDMLEFETPEITDLSNLLKIENNGRVYAVRMDKFSHVNSAKKPVASGLILKAVLEGRLPKEGIEYTIDAGNMATCNSFGYWVIKHCGMKHIHIMSRFFPEDMIQWLHEKYGENLITVMATPDPDVGIEREFYHYLRSFIRGRERLIDYKNIDRRNCYCFWHARYGGEVLKPLGKEIAQELKNKDISPNYIVTVVGAGSTLECLCTTQDCFESKPQIVVPEHINSPIYAQVPELSHAAWYRDYHVDLRSYMKPIDIPKAIIDNDSMGNFNPDRLRQPPKGIPNSVLGPHYDRPNTLIISTCGPLRYLLRRMDHIQQYNDVDWRMMSHYLEQNGMPVGNSSAVNILVASILANQGNVVLTVLFEPLREYYKAPS